MLGRTGHQLQGLRDFAVGEHIQERRLPQGNVERRLQRVVEDRIARAVGKIGENDGVFLGQALALLMRTIVKPARHEQGDQQDGNRNLPELRHPSRRSFCHRHRARACRRTASALGVPLQPLQIGSHVGCVLIAQIAVFLQRLVDDSSSFGGTSGFSRTGGDRSAVQNGIEDDSPNSRHGRATARSPSRTARLQTRTDRVRASSSFARTCSGDM